jgi:hypothetical protein
MTLVCYQFSLFESIAKKLLVFERFTNGEPSQAAPAIRLLEVPEKQRHTVASSRAPV